MSNVWHALLELYGVGEEISTPGEDDGTIAVSEDVLNHLLDYHSTCTTCLLNEQLGRRAD